MGGGTLPGAPGSITALLVRWRDGEPDALGDVVERLHPDLRRMARRHLKGEGRGALQPTELVNEAYVRLAGGGGVDCVSRTHFVAIVARVMRCVLVDMARARHAGKRRAIVVTLEHAGDASTRQVDMLVFDDVMTRLGAKHPRPEAVAELKLLSGLSMDEIARHVGVSTPTAERDWAFAKAWLRRDLNRSSSGAVDVRGKPSTRKGSP